MRVAWRVVVSAILVSACAPATMPTQALPTRPPGELFRGVELPPVGTARVYIFRPGFSSVSATDSPTLEIDGREIARLSIESYTEVIVQPGTYAVSLKPNVSEDRVWEGTWRMTTEAGRVYFLAVWNDVEHYSSTNAVFTPYVGSYLGFLFLPTSRVRNSTIRFEPVVEKDALPVISQMTYLQPSVKALGPEAP